jgi:hypothetical protein
MGVFMEIISLKQAQEQGSNKYFTGIPCKCGHIDYRYTNGGKCCACIADYGKNRYMGSRVERIESAKLYYKDNRQAVLERIRKGTKARLNKHHDLVAEAKNKPCMDCGSRYPACVMDFDHRQGEDKYSSISKLVGNWMCSEKQLLEEIDKCDLVCANCHRIRTFDRRVYMKRTGTMMLSLIERARIFALASHTAAGNRRRYTNEPYICHPAEVFNIVSEVSNDPEILSACYLHDVVEDTCVEHEDIEMEFGPVVGMYVEGLTDISKPEDGNRDVRKRIDRDHTAGSCPEVKTIKCADFLSNWRTIVVHDLKFAKIYYKEKNLLMPFLGEANPILLGRVRGLLKIFADKMADEESERLSTALERKYIFND